MISTQSGQSAAVWTKSVPWGPSEDLCDPKKGHFGPKRALLVSLGAQKRPDTRPKCVVTMIPTQSDQLAAVGTKSGPSGVLRSFSPSQGLFEAKWALLGPTWVPEKAPQRANMTYIHVIYPYEVFKGHLGPFRATSGPQLPLSQQAGERGQKF